MKKLVALIASVILLATVSLPAPAADVYFDPNVQYYNLDGSGTLFLWGIPEANGNPLLANPDYGWPTETAIAAWYATILKAQELNLRVVISYNPVNFEIWYVARPRP